MNINFIGIGGAFNVELGNNASYIIEKTKILFIDMGLDTFDKIVKYNILKNIEEIYVVITHLHGDHVGGLPTFIQYVNAKYQKKVNLISNSNSFTNCLETLLNITGVHKEEYNYIKLENLPFDFKLILKPTSHTKELECFSLIFETKEGNILYTSDSNDFDYVKEKINDDRFIKIYSEVGENVSSHIEYKDIKNLDSKKLVLMHIINMDLYKKIIEDGFDVPPYLK